VIVYNSAAGGEALVLMGGNNPAIMPDGSLVPITIAAVFVQRSTGLALASATPPVTARRRGLRRLGLPALLRHCQPSQPAPALDLRDRQHQQ
jgi:hypothetical protein